MNKITVSALAFATMLLASCGATQKPADSGRSEIHANSGEAVAATLYGDIAGYTQNGVNIFKGVPYAKAGRFEAPQAPDKWDGVRSCRQFGPTSPQGKRA